MSYATDTLECNQGSTFAHGWLVTFNQEPIDQTWLVTTAVVKKSFKGDVVGTFTASVSPQGAVVIALTDEATADWKFTEGFYLVKVTKGEVTLRVAQGRFLLDREV